MSRAYSQFVENAIAPPRFDLLEKLSRRALDPAAHEGEATNAAQKFVTIARRERIDFEGLAAAIAPISRQLPPAPPTPPAACEIVMRFGKYGGMTLSDIAREDLRYIRWMAEEIKDEDLADAATDVLEYFTGRAA
ncbi:MAG TPA: hypothetical protein VIL86_07215 [Tepidisphaeraceae bacterium]|jgi:hypothetical protein